MPDLIPTSVLLARELTPTADSPRKTHRELWQMIVNGELPATQIRGRWFVLRSDLPAIAARLGMTLRANAPASSRVAA